MLLYNSYQPPSLENELSDPFSVDNMTVYPIDNKNTNTKSNPFGSNKSQNNFYNHTISNNNNNNNNNNDFTLNDIDKTPFNYKHSDTINSLWNSNSENVLKLLFQLNQLLY